ncbi:MAG: BrnT family toxin [Proteobacteria bacterium]|nr:BrnT family toxin [Pseudomonadota bacterium]MBU2228392.1 BrnT family toxin [Pseudomonadota bacterium]
MKLTFGWDEVKARENLKKHKVDFDEGKKFAGKAREP